MRLLGGPSTAQAYWLTPQSRVVFTAWGYLNGEYRPVWQSPVLAPGQFPTNAQELSFWLANVAGLSNVEETAVPFSFIAAAYVPTVQVPAGQKRVSMNFKATPLVDLLSGKKKLTTRTPHSTPTLREREFGLMEVPGGLLRIVGLGLFSFDQVLQKHGGLSGYLRAEGAELDDGVTEFPSGRLYPTADDREWLISVWKDARLKPPRKGDDPDADPETLPQNQSNAWLRAWIRGQGLAYLYSVEPLSAERKKTMASKAPIESMSLVYIRPPEPLAPLDPKFPPRFEPARLTTAQVLVLLEPLALVGWDKSRNQLYPLFAEYRGKNLLGRANVQSEDYEKTLDNAVVPRFGGRREVDSGTMREWNSPKSGTGVGREFIFDRAHKDERNQPPKDIFDFALRIAQRVGSPAASERRTQTSAGPWEEFVRALEAYGVPVPDPKRPAQCREARAELQRRVSQAVLGQGKTNPRRKPRRARRNPLTSSAVQDATEYAEAVRKKKPVDADLERRVRQSFRELDTKSPVVYSQESLLSLFPREYSSRASFDLPRRLETLQNYDLVSRAGPIDSVLSAEGREGWGHGVSLEHAFKDKRVLRLLALEAGLSLEDAAAILEQQQRYEKKPGGSQKYTLSPAAVVTKMHRKRKLSAYEPPPAVMRHVGKNILIWMSPTGLQQARVMVFRRGVHIDSDMTSNDPGDMSQMLGKALQASLFWLAAKPGRTRGTKREAGTQIFIGRVGDKHLYTALREGEPLSIQQITKNLTSPDMVQAYTDSVGTLVQDHDDYVARAREQIGERAATPRMLSPEVRDQTLTHGSPLSSMMAAAEEALPAEATSSSELRNVFEEEQMLLPPIPKKRRKEAVESVAVASEPAVDAMKDFEERREKRLQAREAATQSRLKAAAERLSREAEVEEARRAAGHYDKEEEEGIAGSLLEGEHGMRAVRPRPKKN